MVVVVWSNFVRDARNLRCKIAKKKWLVGRAGFLGLGFHIWNLSKFGNSYTKTIKTKSAPLSRLVTSSFHSTNGFRLHARRIKLYRSILNHFQTLK